MPVGLGRLALDKYVNFDDSCFPCGCPMYIIGDPVQTVCSAMVNSESEFPAYSTRSYGLDRIYY